MTSLDPRSAPQSPPGPGWWVASDGNWYPPESARGVAQPQVVVVAKSGNGMAVTALTLGIIGALLGLIPILAVPALICALLALVFGSIGYAAAKRSPMRSGKGMAIAGIVLGAVAFALAIIGFVIVNNAFN
jgi:hypothetical protein